MREFVKGVLILCLLASGTAAAFAWCDVPPTALTWGIRLGGPVVALGCFLVFLKVHLKRDRVPDFLYETFGGYLDRRGLCFAFDTLTQDGICYIRAHFQNRYSRPCQGRIALRPARGFFLTRRGFEHIEFDVDCPAAGYGIVWVPVPVRQEFQGTKQKFDVGASVRYPKWRGRMLRYREGGVVRTNASFRNSFGTALALGGALTGQIVLSTPASVTIALPIGVAESLPSHAASGSQILWRLDDECGTGKKEKKGTQLFFGDLGQPGILGSVSFSQLCASQCR